MCSPTVRFQTKVKLSTEEFEISSLKPEKQTTAAVSISCVVKNKENRQILNACMFELFFIIMIIPQVPDEILYIYDL